MLSYHLPQITPLLHFLILQSTHPSWTCQILFLTTFVLIHIFGEKSYKKSLTPCHTGSSSMTQFPHANYELLIIEIPIPLSFFQRHWRSIITNSNWITQRRYDCSFLEVIYYSWPIIGRFLTHYPSLTLRPPYNRLQKCINHLAA